MVFAKFEGNRFRIDGEIAENHAILVNLTASLVMGQLGVICFDMFWGAQLNYLIGEPAFHVQI